MEVFLRKMPWEPTWNYSSKKQMRSEAAIRSTYSFEKNNMDFTQQNIRKYPREKIQNPQVVRLVRPCFGGFGQGSSAKS
jgi:hypothetical protein